MRNQISVYIITQGESNSKIFNEPKPSTLCLGQHTIWPDMENKIDLLIQDGDYLAYFTTSKGTNTDFNRSAIWADCGIVRLKEGKITEWWSVEDTLSQYRQLGYLVKEPEKVQG